MKILFLAGALFFLHNSYGQSVAEVTGSKISRQDAQKMLDQHNQARKEVGVQQLVWSRELAAFAQEWADHLAKNGCSMQHRQQPRIRNEPVGENLFWGSSSTVYHPLDASLSWYGEKKIYHYGKFGQGNWHAIGHYTQMVWKNTREVGVGVAVCKNGELMVVANYSPAGNYLNQMPY